MTRKRLLLALRITLAVLVTAGAVWWLLSPRPGVTEANCDRIEPGMRREEVEAILGGPPGIYREGKMLVPHCEIGPFPGADGVVRTDPIRSGEQGNGTVSFSENGAVIEKAYVVDHHPTVWEWLRSHLP